MSGSAALMWALRSVTMRRHLDGELRGLGCTGPHDTAQYLAVLSCAKDTADSGGAHAQCICTHRSLALPLPPSR